MNALRPFASLPVAALALTTVLLAGCHVSTNKDGKNDNVDIGTPFGSMHVKTNEAADTASIGLTAYPGAVPVKDNDGEKDSADVNLSFGKFHLGVKAASLQTSDSTDKVLAFYRKDLKQRYGDVIQCQNNTPVGQPTRTSQGLTCSDGNKNHIHNGEKDDGGMELRSGSPQRQHVVGVETKNGGTRIGLVFLDLPVNLKDHDGKDEE